MDPNCYNLLSILCVDYNCWGLLKCCRDLYTHKTHYKYQEACKKLAIKRKMDNVLKQLITEIKYTCEIYDFGCKVVTVSLRYMKNKMVECYRSFLLRDVDHSDSIDISVTTKNDSESLVQYAAFSEEHFCSRNGKHTTTMKFYITPRSEKYL
jgi:hypothetical protein